MQLNFGRLRRKTTDKQRVRRSVRRSPIAVISRLILNLIMLLVVLLTLVVYSPIDIATVEWFADNQMFRLGLFVISFILLFHYLTSKQRFFTFISTLVTLILFIEIVRFAPLFGKAHNGHTSERVKVLTFNARFFFPDYFLNMLKWNNIDIACFQEIIPEYIPDTLFSYRRSKKGPYCGWHEPTDPNGDDGLLIVSRNPLELVQKITCPSYRESLRWIYVFKTTVKDTTVHVIAVHLEPVDLTRGFNGARASWNARMKQAKLVSKVARKIEGPVLIVGDFNSTPTDRVSRVMKRGFKDAGREAGDLLALTWHQDIPLFRIDYILYRGFKTAADPRIFRLGHSDHFVYSVELYK